MKHFSRMKLPRELDQAVELFSTTYTKETCLVRSVAVRRSRVGTTQISNQKSKSTFIFTQNSDQVSTLQYENFTLAASSELSHFYISFSCILKYVKKKSLLGSILNTCSSDHGQRIYVSCIVLVLLGCSPLNHVGHGISCRISACTYKLTSYVYVRCHES